MASSKKFHGTVYKGHKKHYFTLTFGNERLPKNSLNENVKMCFTY